MRLELAKLQDGPRNRKQANRKNSRLAIRTPIGAAALLKRRAVAPPHGYIRSPPPQVTIWPLM